MTKKIKNRLEWAFLWAILVLLVVVFASCRTPKDTTLNINQKEDKSTNKNMELNYDAKLNEIVTKALEKAFKEKLNIKLNQVKYDTDKPVDPVTGKHPIKEETNIDLTKESDENIKEDTKVTTSQSENTELIDKTKEHTKVDIVHKEETKVAFSWWVKLICCIPLFLLGVWGVIRGIKKLLVWKLKS